MENFTKILRDNWFIILFFGSIIITWTNFSNRLSYVETTIANLTVTTAEINQINVSIATIQNDIANIKQTLNNYQIKIK